MGVDKMRRQKRWKKEMEGTTNCESPAVTVRRLSDADGGGGNKERKKKDMSVLPL